MARIIQDPNVLEIANICRNVSSAVQFLRQEGIIASFDGGNYPPNPYQQRTLRKPDSPRAPCHFTPNCTGSLIETTCQQRGKTLEVIRCGKCKKRRSILNAKRALVAQGGPAAQIHVPSVSFFANLDGRGRSQTKLPLNVALLVVWGWSQDYNVVKTHGILRGLVGTNNCTLVDWRNYCRDILAVALRSAPQIGGAGEVVQIDETFLRGRRKYNRGRIRLGDRVPCARRNYGNQVVGPWVFGMAWRRPDGLLDRRLFPVLRRNIPTLRPIVQNTIAQGSTVHSDEWRAYHSLGTWGQYRHRTVNHTENFVNPATGVHTQLIESSWKDLKKKVRHQEYFSFFAILIP